MDLLFLKKCYPKSEYAALYDPKCRLLSMLSLTSFFFLVELIVGNITRSTALVADSFHMLSDSIALVIAYVSTLMAPREWSKNTFGWARSEILGALINAVFLMSICFSILVKAIERFFEPRPLENTKLMLVVGTIGLLVNILGICLFYDEAFGDATNADPASPVPEAAESSNNNNSGTQPRNMNMKAVFLHVLADMLGSVIVMICALVFIFSRSPHVVYLDPFLSIILVVMITISVMPLLLDSARILLQTIPGHIQMASLERKLVETIESSTVAIPDITIHEFHVWQLSAPCTIATAHIRCLSARRHTLDDYRRVLQRIKEFFHHQGIHSTTVQLELVDDDNDGQPMPPTPNVKRTAKSSSCSVECPGKGTMIVVATSAANHQQQQQRPSCVQQTCCGRRELLQKDLQQRENGGKNAAATASGVVGTWAVQQQPAGGTTTTGDFSSAV